VPTAQAPLQLMVQSIMPQKTRIRIIVEGHTDDRPIFTPQFRSNWELSSGRAATIVHFFEDAGFPSDHLESVGFGSTRPLVPNRSPSGGENPENQAKNRRVLIRIVEDQKV
jgi:chemotaxis protein MotB